jgi:hypothetical protein
MQVFRPGGASGPYECVSESTVCHKDCLEKINDLRYELSKNDEFPTL